VAADDNLGWLCRLRFPEQELALKNAVQRVGAYFFQRHAGSGA
jgi:hypothetical protein